jgi:hypothetical protein
VITENTGGELDSSEEEASLTASEPLAGKPAAGKPNGRPEDGTKMYETHDYSAVRGEPVELLVRELVEPQACCV